MTPTALTLWAGLIIGLLFGSISQITGFCFYRGLRAHWASQPSNQLQAFALALAVAVLGTYLIDITHLVPIQDSLYLQRQVSWLLLPLGGMLFGYGMGLANGCGARALVLLGQGNLRSLVVLICLGVSAYVVMTGLLAPLRLYLSQLSLITPAAMTPATGFGRTFVMGSVVIALLLFAFTSRGNPSSRIRDMCGATLIGVLVVAGWLATGWLGADPFETIPPTSLSFVAPVGDTLQYAMLSTGLSLRFGTTVVIGVGVGAFITSLIRKQFILTGFESVPQMKQAIGGGILMGIGGVLALGCTIGQGLSGLSTLSYSSLVSMLAIIIGAKLHATLHIRTY